MVFAALIPAVVIAQQVTPTAAPGVTAPPRGSEIAVMKTSEGTIVLRFFPSKAPVHVAMFKKLSRIGFYNGVRFHRCIEGFMIQGGDPLTKDLSNARRWGTGGFIEDGKEVRTKAEFNDVPHTRGILSTARSAHPDSASSQFFIMHQPAPHLDRQYTVFGQVLSGMDVVDKIVKTGDARANGAVVPEEAVVIKSVTIRNWLGRAKG